MDKDIVANDTDIKWVLEDKNWVGYSTDDGSEEYRFSVPRGPESETADPLSRYDIALLDSIHVDDKTYPAGYRAQAYMTPGGLFTIVSPNGVVLSETALPGEDFEYEKQFEEHMRDVFSNQ